MNAKVVFIVFTMLLVQGMMALAYLTIDRAFTDSYHFGYLHLAVGVSLPLFGMIVGMLVSTIWRGMNPEPTPAAG